MALESPVSLIQLRLHFSMSTLEKKIKIASIIQQGEINRIIDSPPKEFKELLNNMIGLYRLDISFAFMHSTIDEFRKLLREKTGGYDDNHIDILITKVKESLQKIYSDLSEKTTLLDNIEKEIEFLEPKISKIQEIKALENVLINYFKEKSIALKSNIEKTKKIIVESTNAFIILKDRDEVLITLQMIQSEKEELNKKLNILEGEIGKLTGLTECEKKIQIKDGKCTVCNSKINMINDMFDIFHIKKELDKKQKQKKLIVSESIKLNTEELEFRKKEKNIISAENLLLSYEISIDKDLSDLRTNLMSLDKDYQTIFKLNFNHFNDTNLVVYKVDEYSSNLVNDIINIKKDIGNINLEDL